jgi:predicted CoA-binding protein
LTENPSDDALRKIYAETRTIAVVGASGTQGKPAHSIPRFLQANGYRIVPVTPKSGDLLGEPTYPSLDAVPDDIDVVDVFRPAEEAPAIARQAVAARAKVLWLQQGIVSEEAADIARDGGLDVVMGICMGATYERLGRPGPKDERRTNS